MNKVILMGRLVRNPDVRYSQSDPPLTAARFTFAVNRRYRKENEEQQADFISCVTFGKVAEFIEKYCSQGTKLVVEGRIQTGNYTNKEGIRVYTTDVIIENAEFAESKAALEQHNAKAEQTENGDGFTNISDGIGQEGLPFAEI